MDNPSLEIINEIKRKLPADTNIVDFFTTILPMKKESAYRRLRGEIPLTLQECQQVASFLQLSLDKLLKIKENGTCTAGIIRMNGKNIMDVYCKTMEKIIETSRLVNMNNNAHIYAAINTLPISHAFKYPTISKFRIFKWAYQCRNASTPPRMSEIEIPTCARQFEEIYWKENQQIATHYVWVRELFKPYINDVHYMLEMGLITKKEAALLKEEAFLLLEDLETDVTAGITKAGAPLLVYLANTYFDSNYIYVEGNNFKASSINVFGINYLSSMEDDICDDTKEWIKSLTRYSSLISKSNEIEKVNFFNLQRKIIEQSKSWAI